MKEENMVKIIYWTIISLLSLGLIISFILTVQATTITATVSDNPCNIAIKQAKEICK